MLKSLANYGGTPIEVDVKLGTDVDSAIKDCTFLANIIGCNITLRHNGEKFLIDAKGQKIKIN